MDFELSRIKLERNVPEGKQKSLRVGRIKVTLIVNCVKQIQEKSFLVRVCREFELPRIGVIGV